MNVLDEIRIEEKIQTIKQKQYLKNQMNFWNIAAAISLVVGLGTTFLLGRFSMGAVVILASLVCLLAHDDRKRELETLTLNKDMDRVYDELDTIYSEIEKVKQ